MRYLIPLFFTIFLLSVAGADGFDDIVSARNKPDPLVQLTAKERAWLANHKRIRIAFDGSLPPYSFLNDSGQLEGIAIEVMNTLSKRLGINFETYPNTTWNQLYEAAAEHKVDVVATMVNRPDRAQWFIFTQPYLIKSLVIMTKRDNVTIKNRTDLVGKTVAMAKGYQYVDRVIEEFPSVIPYFVDSMLDGLNAVSTEKADAAITFMATASYLQTKYLLTELKVAAFYDRNSANESIAVRKDWPTLAVILQKALDTLSEKETQNIYAKWVPAITPSTDYGLIWKIVTAFILVLVLLLLWIARVRRQNRKIKLPITEVQTTNKILQALQSDHLEHLVLKRTAELNSSENKFRSLVENPRIDYFFFQYDREGIFTYISPSITNMLGYTADEFMTHYHEYLTENPVNLKIDEYTKQCTQGMPNPPYQLEIYDAQKNIHWLEVTDTPVYDEYGKCKGIDGIVHDITERKQADDRLNRLSYCDESWIQKLDRNEENYKNLGESSITTKRAHYNFGEFILRLAQDGWNRCFKYLNYFVHVTTQDCPRCGDAKTRRSSRRTGDGILRILFCKSYRCRECHYRFWVLDPLRLVLFGGIVVLIAIIVGGTPFSFSQQMTIGPSTEAITNNQIKKLTEKGNSEAELQSGLHYILVNNEYIPQEFYKAVKRIIRVHASDENKDRKFRLCSYIRIYNGASPDT
ncbi:MAG: transporter substrate-binding domain-containing protein [Methylococcales bacterium]|nr:transporter substrate-binding domain-containing protein [Methylococcales bacterium]